MARRNQKKKGRKNQRGRAKRRKASDETLGVVTETPENLDDPYEIWKQRRAGARNVGGVRYQTEVATYLVVSGKLGILPVRDIVPEGFEDVDCNCLSDRQTMHVQAKELGDDRRFTLGPLVEVLVHAQPVLKAKAGRIVAVTNARLGRQLQETGWNQSISDCWAEEAITKLRTSLENHNITDSDKLLHNSSIVSFDPSDLKRLSIDLAEVYGAAPAIVSIILARVQKRIFEISSQQRDSTPSSAKRFSVGDLDKIHEEVSTLVDISALQSVVSDGLVEMVGFQSESDLLPEYFLAGVDVNPTHISSNLDVPRPDSLQEICEGLSSIFSVAIVGPSGAGKSALLWRAARDLPFVARAVRIRRIPPGTVPQLLQFVKLLEPSPESPVLICADNVGRGELVDEWKQLVHPLSEIPGVLILVAVREEDLQSGLIPLHTVLVRPTLTREVAQSISTALQRRSVSTKIDVEEAFSLSNGLLMEFITLLYQGDRLGKVVKEQISRWFDPQYKVEREILRYICTADMLGVSVRAEILPKLVGIEDISFELQKLNREHFIITEDMDGWTGLHELRSKVVAEAYHQIPPPTLSWTVGRLIDQIEPHLAAQSILTYARYRGILENEILSAVSDLGRKCKSLHEALVLGKSALICDSIINARAFADRVRNSNLNGLDPYNALWITVCSENVDLSGLSRNVAFNIDRLRRCLPNLSYAVLNNFIAGIDDERLVKLISTSSSGDAAEFVEIVGGRLSIQESVFRSIWDACREHPLAERARVLAAIVHRKSPLFVCIDKLVGSISTRIVELRNCEPLVLNCKESNLEEKLVISVDVACPEDCSKVHSGAVEMCRLIRDLFPEADVFEVKTFAGSNTVFVDSTLEPGHKRIPRENLPTRLETIPRASLLDAIHGEFQAKYWSDRLSVLAEGFRLVNILMEAIPYMLLSRSVLPKRRNEFRKNLIDLRYKLDALPFAPNDSPSRNSTDHSRQFFEEVQSKLDQFFSSNDQSERTFFLCGIGMRNSLEFIDNVLAENLPTLAGIGEIVPKEMRSNLVLVADLLLAQASMSPDERRTGKDGATSWIEVARQIVERERLAENEEMLGILRRVFGNDSVVKYHRVEFEDPKGVSLSTSKWIVEINLSAKERTNRCQDLLGLNVPKTAFRVIVVVSCSGRILPFGTKVGHDNLYRVPENEIQELVESTSLKIFPMPVRSMFLEFVQELSKASRSAWIGSQRGEFEVELASRDKNISQARLIAESLKSQEMKESWNALIEDVVADCEPEAEHRFVGELFLSQELIDESPDEGFCTILQTLLADAIEYDLCS